MAEKMTDKVMRLMDKPEFIRNICTSAHIDHGKCVAGESRVLLADGTVSSAEELYDAVSREGVLVRNDENEVVYLPGKPVTVFSLNKEKGIIECKDVSYAWKLRGGNLIKVKLRNGCQISTTSEHRYIVLEDMEFKEKEAGELRLGDRVVCARNLSPVKKMSIRSAMLELLSRGNFYVNLESDFAVRVKQEILKRGVKSIRTSLKPRSFYHGAWQNRYRLADIIHVCSEFNCGLEELYENIKHIYYAEKGGVGKVSMKIRLPSRPEDFFFLAGLMAGDGSGSKFVVGKKELGEKFVGVCKSLGFEPVKRAYAGKTPEICTNMTVLKMLHVLFDYPLRQKSHNIRVSSFLAGAPKVCIASFLRGYFDCDGTVEKGRSAISLTSVSECMLEELQFLLLQFGVVSIRQGDTLYISGLSVKSFEKGVGFTLPDKKEKMGLLAEKSTGSLVMDTIPLSHEGMASLRKVPMARISQHYYKYEKGLLTPTIRTFNEILHKFEGVHQGQALVQLAKLRNLAAGDLAYVEVVAIEAGYADTVYDFTVEGNHNFVAEGMVIHNTTFSDNLLAGAGMMSEALAGKQLVLDFHEDEQTRGITIDAANVSMVHDVDGKEYLINLIDTPGHIDFSGDVTRAMRAIDGSIVLVCAVEGIMPQTETVLKQALRERVRPVLFINKVDRLIKELKLTPEKMQERFVKIITSINKLIYDIAEKDFKEKWQVSVNDGSVAFGSAFHNWALSANYMKKTGLTFKDVITAYESGSEEKVKELAKKAPLHKVVLDMSVKHHPNPLVSQSYRIPKIWHGDVESEQGKMLLGCDPKGDVAFVCTKIVMDKHAGEVAAGRLFSGTVEQGQTLYLVSNRKPCRLQQVSVYNGAKREQVDRVCAGNIVGLVGLKGIFSGETVSTNPDFEAFELIKHLFEPVVTKAIEASKSGDTPKLVEVLRQVGKEDPTITIQINEETGEHLMSGMGELHLEVIENRIRSEKGVDVKTSEPIVVYREAVLKESPEFEGKSPNKHNKFYFKVMPLDESVQEAIKLGKISEMRVKKKDQNLWSALEECGMESKVSRNVRDVYNGNLLIDMTRGIVHIGEVIEMVMDAFEDVMRLGPLAREPCVKMKVLLMDTSLHEDAIHRGPAQVLPAVREAIRGAMLQAGPVLLEPKQVLQMEAPAEFMGEISKLTQNRRGQLLNMEQEGEQLVVRAKMPVADMFGLASDLRSATNGRGTFSVMDQLFEKLPFELQENVLKKIHQRKGLKYVDGVAMQA